MKTLTAIPCAYCSSGAGPAARFPVDWRRPAPGPGSDSGGPRRPGERARRGRADQRGRERALATPAYRRSSRSTLARVEKPATTRARPARPRLRAQAGSARSRRIGRRDRLGVPGRDEEAVRLVADELRVAHRPRRHDRRLHGQRLAERPGDAEPFVGGVDRDLRGGEHVGHVVPVAPDRDRVPQTAGPGEGLEGRPLLGASPHEEQPGVRPRGADPRERPKEVVVALGLADADLRDEGRGRLEAELPADRRAARAGGVEPVGVGPGVDDVDLRRRESLADEIVLDRLAHGNDARHHATSVDPAAHGRHRKAHAAVHHEGRPRPESSREEREGPPSALVCVHDIDPLATEEPGEARGPDRICGAAKEPQVSEPGGAGLLGPPLARPRHHGHAMPPLREPAREVAELDGRARVEVALGVDLEKGHGVLTVPPPGRRSPARITRIGSSTDAGAAAHAAPQSRAIGSPACAHPFIPPQTLTRSVKPRARSRLATRLERVPPAHVRATGRSRGISASRSDTCRIGM